MYLYIKFKTIILHKQLVSSSQSVTYIGTIYSACMYDRVQVGKGILQSYLTNKFLYEMNSLKRVCMITFNIHTYNVMLLAFLLAMSVAVSGSPVLWESGHEFGYGIDTWPCSSEVLSLLAS